MAKILASSHNDGCGYCNVYTYLSHVTILTLPLSLHTVSGSFNVLESDYSKTETSLDSVRKDFYNTFRLDIMVSVCFLVKIS